MRRTHLSPFAYTLTLLAISSALVACGSDSSTGHGNMSMNGQGPMSDGTMPGDAGHGPMNEGTAGHGPDDMADQMPGGTGMGSDMPGGTAMGDHTHSHAHGTNAPAAEGAREIAVEARSYAFDPAEITASAGEDIAIVLTSTDIEHDFQIDELDAHVSVGAEETATGGFNAGEAGRYVYYCTISGHREQGMEGVLLVQ